ncbi:hypothetical protein RSOLAG1IB_04341 [Rhizoctonia solani AG-1 IB]|uniref:Uncharacterized protein n=1 Tax=Thanatephorus cucumeris (strain AG1-IB / isolate 7/3/14) TaxID=1108050 RepID=A0A0B7FUJ2_THACB|nr:hypothetical protein RSOLAG1IB_04341 [Rhizoctonia solani AG-1 IB]
MGRIIPRVFVLGSNKVYIECWPSTRWALEQMGPSWKWGIRRRLWWSSYARSAGYRIGNMLLIQGSASRGINNNSLFATVWSSPSLLDIH